MPLHAVHGDRPLKEPRRSHLDGCTPIEAHSRALHHAPVEALAPLAPAVALRARAIDRLGPPPQLHRSRKAIDPGDGTARDELPLAVSIAASPLFIVGRSAPVQHAVADVRRERVAVPLLERAGGTRRCVSGEAEQAGRGRAGPELPTAKAQRSMRSPPAQRVVDDLLAASSCRGEPSERAMKP